MKHDFILSCESTVDMPFEYINGRDIPVLFYTYSVGDKTYVDDMLRDPAALPHFYELLKGETLPSTSQINEFQYEEFFEEQLAQGDLLHIAFSSGMSGSYQHAAIAAEHVRERHPDKKLIVIDSLCGSSGFGLLVDMAADLRDGGASIDEVADWVLANRGRVHHHFFSTDLRYFKRSGRVSGPTATLGAILNICPIMKLNEKGSIIAYDKVRGKKNAIRRMTDMIAQYSGEGEQFSGRCFISHSNCPEDAEQVRAAIQERFPCRDIRIFDIGTIIASHCGPYTVAVYFLGEQRKPDEK